MRPALRRFANAMERTLRSNDHKGGWCDEEIEWLLDRLSQEMRELRGAVARNGKAFGQPPELKRIARRDVLREATDVANFAMMIADLTCLPEDYKPLRSST